MPIYGDVRYRMTCRLELARHRLLSWNRLEVGDIFRWIEQVEVDIMELQLREDQGGGLLEPELGMLHGKLSEHQSLLRQHEILWRQKSKVQWIQKGDQNTRFFH